MVKSAAETVSMMGNRDVAWAADGKRRNRIDWLWNLGTLEGREVRQQTIRDLSAPPTTHSRLLCAPSPESCPPAACARS